MEKTTCSHHARACKRKLKEEEEKQRGGRGGKEKRENGKREMGGEARKTHQLRERKGGREKVGWMESGVQSRREPDRLHTHNTLWLLLDREGEVDQGGVAGGMERGGEGRSGGWVKV